MENKKIKLTEGEISKLIIDKVNRFLEEEGIEKENLIPTLKKIALATGISLATLLGAIELDKQERVTDTHNIDNEYETQTDYDTHQRGLEDIEYMNAREKFQESTKRVVRITENDIREIVKKTIIKMKTNS
jgi:hypothetical protein